MDFPVQNQNLQRRSSGQEYHEQYLQDGNIDQENYGNYEEQRPTLTYNQVYTLKPNNSSQGNSHPKVPEIQSIMSEDDPFTLNPNAYQKFQQPVEQHQKTQSQSRRHGNQQFSPRSSNKNIQNKNLIDQDDFKALSNRNSEKISPKSNQRKAKNLDDSNFENTDEELLIKLGNKQIKQKEGSRASSRAGISSQPVAKDEVENQILDDVYQDHQRKQSPSKNSLSRARQARFRSKSRSSATNENQNKLLSPKQALSPTATKLEKEEIERLQEVLHEQFEKKVQVVNQQTLKKMRDISQEHQAVLEKTHLLYKQQQKQEEQLQKNYDALNQNLIAVRQVFSQQVPALHRNSSRGRTMGERTRGEREFSNNTMTWLSETSGKDSRGNSQEPGMFQDLDNSQYSTIARQERNPQVLKKFYEEFCEAIRKIRRQTVQGEEVIIHDLLLHLNYISLDSQSEQFAFSSQIIQAQAQKFKLIIRSSGEQKNMYAKDDIVKNLFKILCGVMNMQLKQRGINPLSDETLNQYLDTINFEVNDNDLIVGNQIATIKLICNRASFSLSEKQLCKIHKKFINLYKQKTNQNQEDFSNQTLPQELIEHELEESREYRQKQKPKISKREDSLIGRGSHYAKIRQPEQIITPDQDLLQSFLNMSPQKIISIQK